MKPSAFLLLLLLLVSISAVAQPDTPVYFSPDPGPGRAQVGGGGITLSNRVLRMGWQVSRSGLVPGPFEDLLGKKVTASPRDAFVIIFRDGRVLHSAKMEITAAPMVEQLKAVADRSRLSERLPGKAIVIELQDNTSGLRVAWRGILRDGSNYLRQQITLTATAGDAAIAEVRMVDWHLSSAKVAGTVKGSPIVAGDVFAGIEYPLSHCRVALGRARCQIDRELPLRAGQSVTYSTVIGISPPGQLRRAFLHYLERERAHPYRTFLHYNSWYDLGYFNPFDERGAQEVVRTFGEQLQQRRKVQLSSYLFDDGWDDPATLWKFNAGFPQGFSNVRKVAEKFGAEPGVWMSPWGGYGKPKQMRLEAARASGYEIMNSGLALSGPKYYAFFRDTCLRMIRDYGVNQFKFDGTGNADRAVPDSEFDSDFDAAIHLIDELRTEKPDLYINLTTGTYPSPFWLQYADSIWRGGEDHQFLGVGTARQRWITYRDADTYEHVVMQGPLYPLNSLMLHGLVFAKHAKELDSDPAGDFKGEIRDYFGNGTQLQEMYITPALLSQENWDDLAEAANWSRANADVLVDSHWVGGDPAQGEVYGWASWAPRRGIIVLRNPSDKSQSVTLKLSEAFELPAGKKSSFKLHSPWKQDRHAADILIRATEPHRFGLEPFDVVIFEATPVSHGLEDR